MRTPDERTLAPDPDGWRALAAPLWLPVPGGQLGLDGRTYAPAPVLSVPDASGEAPEAPTPDGRVSLTLLDDRRESEQQLSLELESARLTALVETRKRLGRMAREARSETAHKWAADRAAACARPLGPRVAACGTRGLAVRCGCGPRVYWRGCRQWWVCARCRGARLRPLAPRLVESIAARVAEEQRGGHRVAIRFVTLTVRTSGDVAADRATLGDSFRRWYKSLHKWIGRHAYALVYEVTPGASGAGHVHAHAMMVWPAWLDYGRVRALWISAARGASSRIDIRSVGGDARGAARYVGKYLSKGSDGLGDDLAGRVIAAFYLKRAITASRGFWVPRCGCTRCGQAVVRVDALDAASPWVAVGYSSDALIATYLARADPG